MLALAGAKPALPPDAATAAHDSVGGALAVAHNLNANGWTELGSVVHNAATAAFDRGLSAGCLVAGATAAVGAIFVAVLLPSYPERRDAQVAAPQPKALQPEAPSV